MNGRYKLSWLCEALMVSRSGYYDWLRRRKAPGKRAKENAVLREQIKQEFARSRQTYGSHRIVRKIGGGVSRKRVARLMREQHLWARQRSKYRVATTDSRHSDPIAPNRLPGLKGIGRKGSNRESRNPVLEPPEQSRLPASFGGRHDHGICHWNPRCWYQNPAGSP